VGIPTVCAAGTGNDRPGSPGRRPVRGVCHCTGVWRHLVAGREGVDVSKHTPGPWTVNGAGGTFAKIARLTPAGVIVSANRVPQPAEEISNARLIAAAPDLLEALKALHDCPGWTTGTGSAHDPRCDGSCSVGCPVPVEIQEPCEVCDLIAKAEGQ